MKKALIWIGGGLLALVAIFAGGAFFMLSQFDAKGELSRALETATGRRTTITGNVDVALWPRVGFTAKGVTIANIPGGEAPSFAEIKDVQVGVAVAPLLQRQLEIAELVLVEPVVNLEVTKDGRPNWIFAPPPASPGAAPIDPTKEMKGLSLGDVRLERGRLVYANAATNVVYRLDEIAVKVGLDSLNAPLTLEGAAKYKEVHTQFTLEAAKFVDAIRMGAETPLAFALKAEPVAAKFTGQFDPKTGALAGAIEAQGQSLRKLSAWIATPLGEGQTLGPFSVSGQLALKSQGAAFTNASFALDAIRARGDFEVLTGRERPYVSGRLELADLDLNPYLAPPAPPPGVALPAGADAPVTIAAVDIEGQPGGWSRAPMDLSGLKALDMDLDLTTGPLKFQKLTFDRAKLGLVLNGGFLAATLSDLSLYGGAGEGRLEIDARAEKPAIRQELSVANVMTETFLRDMAGFSRITGRGDVTIALTSTGGSQQELMSSLDGRGAFLLREGALKGVNLGGVSRTIRQALSGEVVGPNAQTAFSTLSASFTMAKGVAATKDFELKAKDAEVTALGLLDLGRQAIDISITPRSASILSRITPFQNAGIAVPFRVSGGLTGKLSYKIDLQGAARNELSRRLDAATVAR